MSDPEPQDNLPKASFASTSPVTDEMLNRFLGWKLPANFFPDCGISFKPLDDAYGSWPTGTNLLDAQQAKDMLEYVLKR